MKTTTTGPKKMVAKFQGHCPICDLKIKAGSDSIAHAGDMPACHWACLDTLNDVPENKYGASEEVFAIRLAAVAAGQARWAAACAAKSVKAAPVAATYRAERGSLGGSQLAEDMGDYSGKH